MSDFTAIGQLVTEARNLLDSIKGGAIRTMQSSFDNAMNGFTSTFNSKLTGYQGQMNLVTKAVMEVINGVNVYHVAGKKMYTMKHNVANGGYKKGANLDPNFPNVADPTIPPTYFNLIEFVSNSGFGGRGDLFRVEFYQTHHGMTSPYLDHFVFTGTSSLSSVSGYLEVKKTTAKGICLFISQPSGDREIPITKDMEGKVIPISLRDIGQGYDSGIARLTLKVDTRHQAGASRNFCLNGEYTSSRGRPPVSLVNDKPVHWSK
ncbi:Phage tail protein [Vibrio crassostreae]|uniref:hypothetical protein n=1 Tax=Vibrio crassostreae TaxID=246167 RepID=UPI001B306ED8|nr:hypothetical protein [Vibrio crassostreae]CAK1801105.1 Phage tail protein [Vibrio crassostreae]CAK1814070.1 Phage tail protein [Vibrio crassostreae]CAK1817760.1 Phage tail protein [Vibrio crassostreae]CAK2287039.1 Phage tail protein [Vibrio crassostreae]CAK2287353.1 Phage tail protein [Vibrio crassostreae]